MRPFGVVLQQPGIKVCLQRVEVCVGLATEGDGEEFLLGGANEALHKAIGLWTLDGRAPVFNVVEGEKDLIGMRVRPTEFASVGPIDLERFALR